MKKKVLSGLFALALLVATGYGVNESMKSNTDLSDLVLANIEALAENEDGEGGNTDCKTIQSSSGRLEICYGMGKSEWVTDYSFECTGKNGSCSGKTGTVGRMCSGYVYPPLIVGSKKC